MNAARIAGIVRDWVQGDSLEDIGRAWFSFAGDSPRMQTRAASEYVYQKLVGQVPWGIGALQKLTIGDCVSEGSTAASIPSMVYYGVSTPEAAVMRMAGMPRTGAEMMGRQWLRPDEMSRLRRVAPGVQRTRSRHAASADGERPLPRSSHSLVGDARGGQTAVRGRGAQKQEMAAASKADGDRLKRLGGLGRHLMRDARRQRRLRCSGH